MTDKDIILNDDAFTNKCMAGDLTVFADLRTFLDLYKVYDLAVVNYLTAIEILEIIDFNIFPQYNIGSNSFQCGRFITHHFSLSFIISLLCMSAFFRNSIAYPGKAVSSFFYFLYHHFNRSKISLEFFVRMKRSFVKQYH
jgi:hypothetical protein